MNDLISRHAVLENAFEVETKEYGRIEVVGVDVITDLPTIKVMHCKDCRYFCDNNPDTYELHCTQSGNPNGFCHIAKPCFDLSEKDIVAFDDVQTSIKSYEQYLIEKIKR